MNIGLLALRLAVGGIFLIHGLEKVMNIESTIGFFGNLGLSPTLAWVVAIVETLGGLAIIFGIVTEIVAIFLAIIMIGAIVFAKNLILGSAELEILLIACLICLMAMGSGAYSLANRKISTIPSAM